MTPGRSVAVGGCQISCAVETFVVVGSVVLTSSTPNVNVKVRESASWRTSTPGGADTVIDVVDVTRSFAHPGRFDGDLVGSALGGGPAVVAPGVTVADDGLISALTGSADGR